MGEGLETAIKAGKDYEIKMVVDEKGLDNAIGLEIVITHTENGKEKIYKVIPLQQMERDGNLFTFRAVCNMLNAGSFKLAIRMYPKNDLLPHRQDFCYVRWF